MKNHRLLVLLFVVAALWTTTLSAQLRTWDRYEVIMWTSDEAYRDAETTALFIERMKEMGVTAGMVHHHRDPAPLVHNNFPFYVENVVNKGLCLKWNSNVRNWSQFVDDWKKNGRSKDAFIRDYCLDDPEWQAWARKEVDTIVERNRMHNPIAYDLRDELSITISANPFDYDFSPQSLASFRKWLKTQYASLDALNAQWETAFRSWDAVTPFSTDEIKNRMAEGLALPRGSPHWQRLARLTFDPVAARAEPTRWNFAPWADFRTYMDVVLARTLGDLREAVRARDSATPVGIEGTQMPSAFGGYDLWRLSSALDWVEPYDIGNAREVFADFMPGKPILSTVFEKETRKATRRLWHLLLLGDRGCIIWWSKDCLDWSQPDIPLTAKGAALAPALREMTGPLARLFLLAEREYDRIAIHYSQASIQAAWLIGSCGDGSTWQRRFSSYEATHNHGSQVRNSWLKYFQDLGYSPRFVSYEQIENGALEYCKAFVMPHSLAMSDEELEAVRMFARRGGGRLLAYDAAPAVFDGHATLRSAAPEPLFPGSSMKNRGTLVRVGQREPFTADIVNYGKERLSERPTLPAPSWLADGSWLPRFATVTLPGETTPARVLVHRYIVPGGRLVALERNINYHMSEALSQAGGNERLEKPVSVTVTFADPVHLTDLRSGKTLGHGREFTVPISPWEPSLFAAMETAQPTGNLIQRLTTALTHGQ